VNEHHRLEVAIYEVEEDLFLREMRRFVREEIDFISKVKEFVRSAGGPWLNAMLAGEPGHEPTV
jgi:hypothetical protein